MIVNIATTHALNVALVSAKAGDVIRLAEGVYSNFQIRNLSFATQVTITSQDPGRPAQLTGFTIANSTGLKLQDLELVVDPAKAEGAQYQISGSRNIGLDRLDVHGGMNGDPQDDNIAFLVRDSSNVSIANSEFQQLQAAINHQNNSGLTISGNTFHDLRSDGIMGGGSSDVVISGNTFADFHPLEGDHPDAIQFWSTRTLTKNVVVTGNVVVRGAGEPVQGVFLNDEGGGGYQNVRIVDNLIVGGMGNGVAAANVSGLVIDRNIVSPLPDAKSFIRVEDSDNIVLTNNQAGSYHLVDNTLLTEVGDKTLVAPTDGGAALLTSWLARHALAPAIVAPLHTAAADALDALQLERQITITVTGGAGSDRLTGDGVHNARIDGGGGDDVLLGGGYGFNTMVGGAGNDSYTVYTRGDSVVEYAGGGADTVSAFVDFVLPANVETLWLKGEARTGTGNALSNALQGTAGNDTLIGLGGDDAIYALDGADRILGGDGADTLNGRAGDDTVAGDNGDDRVYGEAGRDSLSGGAGNDIFEGGAGADTISGGAGTDLFVFRTGDAAYAAGQPMDTILDYAAGERIDLGVMDSNSKTTANDRFIYIGNQAFHRVAGELRAEVSGATTILYGDQNGDGVADMAIKIIGAPLNIANVVL